VRIGLLVTISVAGVILVLAAAGGFALHWLVTKW
jgi:hypothetical protein